MKKIIAGNWKMFKTPKEARAFWTEFKSQQISDQVQIVFFPSAPCLEAAGESLSGTPFEFGSQNCHFENSGAFTGEISPLTVLGLGAKWALLGHSERRSQFSEASDLIAKKARAVQGLGMTPMICVGELLHEREAGKTNEVIAHQLTESLSGVDSTRKLAVAYEPVWAIGTGRVAGPEQVQETHAFIRGHLEKMGFTRTPILYGGSVKADNAKGLVQLPNVDGFLIGGASLDVASLSLIANCQA